MELSHAHRRFSAHNFYMYKGKTVKQADVVLLPFPLLMPMNASTRSNDLKFYENRTRSPPFRLPFL